MWRRRFLYFLLVLVAAWAVAQPCSVFVEIRAYGSTETAIAELWTTWIAGQLPRDRCELATTAEVKKILAEAKFDYRKSGLTREMKEDLQWEKVDCLIVGGVVAKGAGKFSLICRLLSTSDGQDEKLSIQDAGEEQIRAKLTAFLHASRLLQPPSRQAATARPTVEKSANEKAATRQPEAVIPQDIALAERAAQDAMQRGQREAAVRCYRQAMELAADGKEYARVVEIGDKITALYRVWPDWAEAKYAQASQLPDTQQAQQAMAEWKRVNDLAVQKIGLGQYREAQRYSEQAWQAASKNFGPHHPCTIRAVNLRAMVYQYQGDYNQALPMFEECWRKCRESLGDKHPNTLSIAGNLALLYASLAKYDLALPLLEQTVASLKETLGINNFNTLSFQSGLAGLYTVRAAYDKARPLLEETARCHRELFGDNHPDTLIVLNNLAALHKKLGNLAESRSGYEEVLQRRNRMLGSQHVDTLMSLNNLAAVYEQLAEYDKARELFENSLAERRRLLGPSHPDTLQTINNMAGFYEQVGERGKAQAFYEEALRSQMERLGAEHPDTLLTRNNLAQLHTSQGEYGKALPLLQEALAIQTRVLGARHPDTLLTTSNLGRLYNHQGEHDKAMPLFEEAANGRRQVLGPRHPDTLKSLVNLASTYVHLQKYDKAAPLYEESFQLHRELLGPEHPNTAVATNNLALFYYEYGNAPEKAITLLEQASASYEKLLGRRHPDTLTMINNLAAMRYEQGQRPQARALMAEVVALKREVLGASHPDTLGSLNNLAILLQMDGMLAEAEPFWRQVLADTTRFLERELWTSGERTRQSYLSMQSKTDNNLLSFYLARNTPSTAREAMSFALTRKGIRLRISSETKSLAQAQNDPGLRQAARSLGDKRRLLAGLTVVSGQQLPADFASRSRQLEEEIAALENTLGRASEKFRRQSVEVTPELLLQKLPADSVVFDFMTFRRVDLAQIANYLEDRLAVVVAAKDISPAIRLIDLGPLEPVREALRKYRQQVTAGGQVSGDLGKTAQTLYEKVWQPLAVYAQGKKCVYLVPDGVLHLLPFAALVDRQGKYLVESVPLVTLASSRDLAVEPQTASKQAHAVVFAAPDYDRQGVRQENATVAENKRAVTAGRSWRDLHFTYLPGTAREGAQLARALRERHIECSIYAKEQAMESHIYRLVMPRILHIATHGFFLDSVELSQKSPTPAKKSVLSELCERTWEQSAEFTENPLLRSGLAFTGANPGLKGSRLEDGTDGILTAYEVLDLNLSGTALVVLSACETGVGRIEQGEGVYSLHRAFQEAGARAVVFTLWPTSDSGTQLFMQKFYSRYLGGKPVQEALRETQREFVADRDLKMAHPFYWAQFVGVGR